MQRYLGKLLGYQTAISLACLGALFLGGVGIYAAGQSSELAVALVGVSFATPCVLMLAFARRALYLEYRSTTAASGAVLYSVLLFSGFWFLDRANGISPFSVFLDIGASALAASMLLMLAVRPSLKQSRRDANFPVANEHWCYGRWALGSSICIWIAWNVWYTILGSISGLAETGSLKALINIAMPVIQSCAALSLLVLPHTAEVAHSEGRGGAKRQALIVALLFAGGATLYWAAVLLCRDPLIAFLYSGRYRYTGNDLPWLALASIASAAIVGPASALRALEKPATVCIAFLISSSAGLIIGIPATRFFGVSGAISGILISSLLALGVLVFALARGKRLQARSGAPEVSTQLAQ
jgi:O-antigen/teichoic acid export membrane protein